ncbi:sodium/glutamate symporter [Vibrio breoganii]|uniref:sodium/glutamate symporter n=1 Tax=Vibrio breoganii TaxID=553239 RepID=UPI000315E297|nr:sodium/glutamate symporter [Vibrio breoganii]OEF81239.1 sodium/glutamate symporter [Vibrio breoganii 1C10]
MTNSLSFNAYASFALAVLVLSIGQQILKRVHILRHYHIPAPIIGGIVLAVFATLLHQNGTTLNFELPLKTPFMLMFFASVGFSANLALLRQGGKTLIAFLFCATLFIVFQDVVGIGMAEALGLDPLLGLLAGSITLSGGHGTGAAWADIFADDFHINNALEIAMACATFGLVVGGILGGPLGNRLIQKHSLASEENASVSEKKTTTKTVVPSRKMKPKVISFGILLVTGLLAQYAFEHISALDNPVLKFVPNFVYAIAFGVIVGNIPFTRKKLSPIAFDIGQVGGISLGLFLAMALMELKLWNLLSLATPLLVILFSQLLFTILFVYWITFRVMGQNYDAAVMSAGHVGFGMGATPTAMMNLNTITSHYGASTKAYFVVPLVGAFFIDIVNLVIIQAYIAVLG